MITTFLVRSLIAIILLAEPSADNGINSDKASSFQITNGICQSSTIESRDGLAFAFTSSDSLKIMKKARHKDEWKEEFVAVVPRMFAHSMRGPQIAATSNGIVLTVCTQDGDIFCYKQDKNHRWQKTGLINKPGTAKEGLMAVAGNGKTLIAVWLNALEVKGQSLYAGVSTDGGDNWKSREIYTSPDGTTCECCKPSISVREDVVYIMFRNYINGNRDMHIMKSEDGGVTFGKPEQVGTGNWKLNGCPMDGGDLQINHAKQAVTIWRREGKLYTSVGTGNETFIAEGKNGSLQPSSSGNSFAWVDKGVVVVQTRDGEQHRLGEGVAPKLKELADGSLLCTWQKDKAVLGWQSSAATSKRNVNP